MTFRAAPSHGPWPAAAAEAVRASYAEAVRAPFWLDRAERPPASEPPGEPIECDLAIVGGGLSGLWAALLAVRRDPGREVVVLEADRVAAGASGRNGGFLSSFLTHGIDNGLARFPEEMEILERLGLENFAAIEAAVATEGIECDFEPNGDLDVAVEPHEVEWLGAAAEQLERFGHEVELLDRDAILEEVRSPLYQGALHRRSGGAIVDPARLCWGLARVAREAGVRVFERAPVEGLERSGAGVRLRTPSATVDARAALLATSASAGLLGAIRRRVVPVYDYVLVTEPLTPAQRESIGWRRRQGIGDLANRFHYYRLTADDRIVFGGYDAIYYYGSGIGPRFEQREASCAMLASHFFAVFPQLEGVRFSHRWGGAIDTCSRFFAFHGLAIDGRVAYTVGHTGLGVGASRFGAEVALDLLAGHETEATRLRAIRAQPAPFPPEPLRWAAIELTRNRLAVADARGGRRGIWLRALDRLGLGFDS